MMKQCNGVQKTRVEEQPLGHSRLLGTERAYPIMTLLSTAAGLAKGQIHLRKLFFRRRPASKTGTDGKFYAISNSIASRFFSGRRCDN